ncbi:hypothetical protein ANME2D_01027 [Candidatus Methanoperedens nitroreducens]|uniref:Uncharacterized protein n=1 Tax=Candidatus Methanoperedens nitratireducens TaxID=1392998 RepID=A0A062V7Q6_9EURY|nr:hypothetical protein [Candidatus Methanoperedens nitroreducens]KCZ72598.1 hypothetical protein ANME2D_01027 [Candidatus Methanoperedens nitroreducens]MDJ1423470.1 hypothetical protein [Candidatus Methanoperedens sp.]
MKYLYGDSTEFPVQRDFLGLLDDFIDTSVKAITLENTVFDMKEDIRDKRRLKNSVMDEMNNFLLTVENAISAAVSSSKEQVTIVQYAEKSRDFLKKYIEDGKKKISDDIFHEITQFEEKVNRTDEENRKTLEAFFIKDPVPIINKKYTLKATKEAYSSKVQVDCEGDISCVFEIASSELPLWDGHVKAYGFVRGVEIPARMKKPFLKKELAPDIVSIDNYLLSDLVLCGKELEVVFRKKLETAAERFRLRMDFSEDFTVEIYHAEENGVEKNIQAVPGLKDALNVLRLRELGEKIMEQTDSLYPKKQRLEHLYLGGKDVLEENLVYELMQRVAEIFAPTLEEIKKHSPSKEEFSLKSEDESGKRREIYLKKSQIKEKIGVIKEKGGRLLQILDML